MKTVRFLRRRNLGQYEHTELEIGDTILDGQDPISSVRSTMQFVEDALFGKGEFSSRGGTQLEMTVSNSTIANDKTATATMKVDKAPKVTTVAAKVETATKVATPEKENAKQDGGTTSEAKPQEESLPGKNDKIEANSSEVVKEEKKAVVKETKLVVKAKGKNTVYDRTLDTHKNLLGIFLDSKFPEWRKPEILKKAGLASRELNGKDFQGEDGEILEAFKEAFSKYME